MPNINDKIIVTISGIKDYGIFFEYEDYSGLVHISELSDKFIRNVSDFFKIGDHIKVLVLNVDENKKKLNASYKQIREKQMNRYYEIGFKTIKDNYDKMLLDKLKEIRHE